ncbi:hypothetical protein OHS33_37695 (plasmid) [Streptomyces sp. NBC_00536]|uniref:hypothetical protein n=1 Tax=Streptomyces sp. NBC_00536 TaxID=2975769 RepID=UPI002E81A43E|nr:hypothetical protein [Streptomyces sp. NBC_00536]WUC84139.1 hypothetical protein OHS33_37695 [Streptomyces sp. NBC_00536]
MYIGKKLAATTALIGALTMGAVAAAPAGAAPQTANSPARVMDVGIRLSTNNNVGVYGWYFNIDNAHKVAYDLSPRSHDGIDVDCYSELGANLGYGTLWYHTYAEYHNDAGWSQHVYGWTYAPYVDNGAAKGSLRNCGY